MYSNEFPLENKCLIKIIIYKVTNDKETKYFIKSTGNTFKTSWYGHKSNIKM